MLLKPIGFMRNPPAAGGSVIVDTDFGATFPTGAVETTMDTDLGAQVTDFTYTHLPSLVPTDLDAAYSTATTGAIFLDKLGDFPSSAFKIEGLTASTNYLLSFKVLIGEAAFGGSWAGNGFQLRIGNAKFDSSVVQYEEPITGQPKEYSQTNAVINTGALTTLWFTFFNNSSTGGTAGGDIYITDFKLEAQ